MTLATIPSFLTMTLTFLAPLAFFTGAFLVAAGFALVANLLSVIAYTFNQTIDRINLMTFPTFFAVPRLDGAVAFLAVVVGFTLPAKTFLGAAAVFLAGEGPAGFLVVVALAGLEFCREINTRYVYNKCDRLTSFEPDVKGFVFRASLTLPDGPLGSTKMPPSAPLVMARFS